MKKYMFLGTLYPQSKEIDYLKLSNIGLQGAPNTFQWAVIKGMEEILDKKIDIYNVLPVGTYPRAYKKLFLESKTWGLNNKEIGSINIPFVKQSSRTIKLYKELKWWLTANTEEKEIIVYGLYPPFIIALNWLKKNIKQTFEVKVIVTDLPGRYGFKKNNGIIRLYDKVLELNYINRLQFVDGYVLLTEEMKYPLEIEDTKYTIVEGIVDTSFGCGKKLEKKEKNIILYTGSLNFEFGIMNLVRQFSNIIDYDCELWICGSGQAKEEIIKSSKIDNRIKFYGYVSKNEVVKMQDEATILVNPRPNEGEYTKYSFPSKTMEYLKARRPVVMYKLAGIPQEYDEHLFYIDADDPKGITNKLIEIMDSDLMALNEKVNKAYDFVVNEKCSIQQSKKIIEL